MCTSCCRIARSPLNFWLKSSGKSSGGPELFSLCSARTSPRSKKLQTLPAEALVATGAHHAITSTGLLDRLAARGTRFRNLEKHRSRLVVLCHPALDTGLVVGASLWVVIWSLAGNALAMAAFLADANVLIRTDRGLLLRLLPTFGRLCGCWWLRLVDLARFA